MIDVAQPAFQRTSTAPVVSFNAPSLHQFSTASASGSGSGAGTGFQTSHEIMQHAKGIVNKDAWRRSTRELQPYGSGHDIGPDDDQSIGGGSEVEGMGGKEVERGMKRTNDDDDDDDDDQEGTEVDEDEEPPIFEDDNNHTNDTEFPPVFESPNLTQPELFQRPFLPSRQPAQMRIQNGRMTRGLPSRNGTGTGGRMLGKTVSAPVGSLWGGGDVDMDGNGNAEDGFDISEWAKEEF